MDDEIKPLLYCCHPRIPKLQCCLWAVRLGAVDKKSNPERKGSYINIGLCSTLLKLRLMVRRLFALKAFHVGICVMS